ncbi:LysE family translocator [Ostreibacterium oceani]|uniref:LysE family translocator n=1 Tax=Ostreibacterium oceani TaxID=2654998 RepID=A0A6N7F204_9GAMM|nr:LysE family translocator [Ostreibacterium oceani]MPV85896.1 LysE family translocator [Ostreibacterium oceani]
MLESINVAILTGFIATFAFVSLTPGLCMTLALTMGMQIGFKKTLWLMFGELIGVAIVAIASVMSVAVILLNYPQIFMVIKYGGGLYLAYIGINMWLSKGKLALNLNPLEQRSPSRMALMFQGLITAVSNPKGWAFFIALLPPFIDQSKPLYPQLIILIGLIVLIEFASLCLYCEGGKTLRRLLQNTGNVKLINRISGSLMIGVAIWLAFG